MTFSWKIFPFFNVQLDSAKLSDLVLDFKREERALDLCAMYICR